MKIGLLGQFGGGNSGNDASFEAMATFLSSRMPDARLVCFCPNPERVESRYAVHSVASGHPGFARPAMRVLDRLTLRVFGRLANLLHPLRETRGLDFLVVPGTGFLDDFQEKPLGWPFMIFRWCLAARLAGARIAFVSVGAGPIVHPLSRWFLTRAARMCAFRSYRDGASRAYMRSVGFDVEGDPVYPDLAFKLTPPARAKAGDEEAVTVGVGIMAYSGWRRGGANGAEIYGVYRAKIARFLRWLVANGYEVRLVTGDEQDKAAVKDVLREIEAALSPREKARLAFEPTTTLHELMAEIGKTDVVVATRFHNVVCALKMARPTISLSYASKNDVLLEEMGLKGWAQRVEDFDVDLLIEQVKRVVAERRSLSERIGAAVHLHAARLAEQDTQLLQLFALL